MAYTARTQQLVARVRAEIAAIADAQVRDLTGAWVMAWNEIQPDLQATLTEMLVAGDRVSRAQLMRSQRLLQVLELIRGHLDDLAATGMVRIIGDLGRVIDVAGGAQRSVIDSQLPATGQHLLDLRDWSRVDPAAVEAIVRRSTEQITSRFKPLSASADRAVRTELVRGFAAGSNPRQTAARIVARTEGQFNGGLTRALAIARTETLDASRAGARAGRLLNADVLAGWSWHCELSTRSCQACIAMDGQVFPVDAAGPNDHVNGRCVAVPVTRSWADLGFEGIEEPEPIRASGADWFDAQDEVTQRQILGPSRYEAWRAGDYPMSAWSEVRTNDGWRDSIQVTKAPAQSGGRNSSGAAA